MLDVTMNPTQTETPQYNSRRERHQAEDRAQYGPTRRELRKIERSNEYLESLRLTTEGHIANTERWPGNPIMSMVDARGNVLFDGESYGRPRDLTDDLDTHLGIVGAYQTRVDNGDWNVINELDRHWHDAQPTEADAETKFAEYEENDPQRVWKIGQFISRRIFGARQHWLNQRTEVVKHRMSYDYAHGTDRQEYKKAA
ncbi:MAG: hypothetical protein JWO99_795 [Candidatus Saccharibacteria bacterium]|nr:hypothetical protein [Candidatus Saccharibacteria bacterium]